VCCSAEVVEVKETKQEKQTDPLAFKLVFIPHSLNPLLAILFIPMCFKIPGRTQAVLLSLIGICSLLVIKSHTR
jgi:hypothetical protein